MKDPVFTGACTALITPFRDGTVDFRTLYSLLEFQISSGIDAITVCGTTGEASTMTDKERRDVIAFCASFLKGRAPLIAGAGSNDTSRALEHCLAAENSGADALLVSTPYYNKTTQTGLISHFSYLADRVSVPIILYNVPSRTGMTIHPETYRILSQHPNIVGTKDASGNVTLWEEILRSCADGFQLWSGNDSDIVPLMALGGAGVISVLSNIIPRTVVEMTHACLSGSFRHAAELQLACRPLEEALFTEVNPIPVKAALEMMGFPVGDPRLPLVPLSTVSREKLECAMQERSILP